MNVLEFHVKKAPHSPGMRPRGIDPFGPVTLFKPTPPKNSLPAHLRLLSCGPVNGSPVLRPYTTYLNNLLHGRLHHLVLPEQDAVTAVQQAARHNDLVILDEPEQTITTRLWQGRPGNKFAAHLPASVLVTRQPLWPLHHLLLILRLDAGDETAVFWTKQFAQASGAAVTILPLVPALPAMYAPQPNGVSALLSSQTTAGQQVRLAAQQLNEAQVTAVIHLRQGDPGEQIRSEVEKNLYDMVLLGAESTSHWQRWLLGSLVAPVLSWIARPVLVARPPLRTANLTNCME